MFAQNYDPFGNLDWSIAAAAAPLAVLLAALGFFRLRAAWSVVLAAGVALFFAVVVDGMPPRMALSAAAFGAAKGLVPLGWIVVNVVFLQQIVARKGYAVVLKDSLARACPDQRLQVLLVAFCAASVFEGIAAGGAPVAMTAALLASVGFPPSQSAALALVAHVAPAAFGASGSTLGALAAASGIAPAALAHATARVAPLLALLVPWTLVTTLCGWRTAIGAWPVILGVACTYAVAQALVAVLHGPWLADLVAAAAACAVLFAWPARWRPREPWTLPSDRGPGGRKLAPAVHPAGKVARAWLPWVLLAGVLLLWNATPWRAPLNGISAWQVPWPDLHGLVVANPPAVAARRADPAIFVVGWLSTPGSGVLVAALLTAAVLGSRIVETCRIFIEALWLCRTPLLTIALVGALAQVSRSAGHDATIALAAIGGGILYPLAATWCGALGSAMGGDALATSPVFGEAVTTAASTLDFDGTAALAATVVGGAIGRLVDVAAIVATAAASRASGTDGEIQRRVFPAAVALALAAGLLAVIVAAF